MSGSTGARRDIWAPAHPDGDWLDQVQAAVDAWRAAPLREPTSSLTGGGAIRAFEEEFSMLVAGRPTLLVPSATYGLRLALEALGVGPGDEVIIPSVDWPASKQAVRSLGAVPVQARVDAATQTIDPSIVAALLTARTKTVVACHLDGAVADVAGVRDAVGQLPIVEDCAAALGALLDGEAVAAYGDLAVFSFGPGKHLDLGEGGAVVASADDLYRRALALSAHPTRLRLAGIEAPTDHPGLMMRGNPMTALRGWHALRQRVAALGCAHE